MHNGGACPLKLNKVYTPALPYDTLHGGQGQSVTVMCE
jgi:hypothetical protein